MRMSDSHGCGEGLSSALALSRVRRLDQNFAGEDLYLFLFPDQALKGLFIHRL